MSLTYSQYISDMQTLLVVPAGDAGFAAIQNMMIDDAELRCYRDLELLDQTARDTSGTFTVSSRTFNLPTAVGTFIVVHEMNVITPFGTTVADNGTRNPLKPASRDLLDALYPNSTGSTVPVYMAMLTQDTVLVGPFPDQAYNVEVVGVQRPTPLYISQTTSPLSVYFPDVFVAASMIFASGYQRNFGAMSDDPKMAGSWEAHYQSLLKSAQTEEARKKFLLGRNEPPAMPMKVA